MGNTVPPNGLVIRLRRMARPTLPAFSVAPTTATLWGAKRASSGLCSERSTSCAGWVTGPPGLPVNKSFLIPVLMGTVYRVIPYVGCDGRHEFAPRTAGGGRTRLRCPRGSGTRFCFGKRFCSPLAARLSRRAYSYIHQTIRKAQYFQRSLEMAPFPTTALRTLKRPIGRKKRGAHFNIQSGGAAGSRK